MNNAANLYTFLSKHCPALSKLWIMVVRQLSTKVHSRCEHLRRMLDISDGLTDFDLRWKYDAGLLNSRDQQLLMFLHQMEAIKERADTPAPGEATLESWKTRRPAPALMCWISKFESGSTLNWGKVEKSGTSSWLWMPTLKSNIACHQDGTPVYKYKGLAQIFDGEPW
ncbi:uncharacterized protein EAF01_011392 [Botrytis porri]|uniref:uncharacterized protein n=1 Tax=Botrytis porri TaxID=87229 RepID=UPI0019002386|nr:uncharacterized protein EAF01_011392 [Botrytis porri]KAF7885327.1 hypothetical protein EAF01_011392 [Botrytis porri]